MDILVLGAGMVGTATALELALRGHTVTLLDRRGPGQETSYGNAGVIQREAVEPYAFPRAPAYLLSAAFGRRLDLHYHVRGVMSCWRQLWQYWRASRPASHRRISQEYATLIAHSTAEHGRLIDAAGAEDLIRRDGLRMIYRSHTAWAAAANEARRISEHYGIAHAALDGAGLAAAEPAFRIGLAGAIHWTDSWSAIDPGALVERYAELLKARGGRIVIGDAALLEQSGAGWRIRTPQGLIEAEHCVVALGPWAGAFTRHLGYRLPLFVKRGYHRHYVNGATLNVPTLDAERGYVMAPQRQGLRISTGAEIAAMGAAATPVQLARVEREASALLHLGTPRESEPWLGNRPCSADMKPVIGPAPRHAGLWFNFGHGHQGFTLGPASARLLADLIEGKTPYTDARPFLPSRFSVCGSSEGRPAQKGAA